MQKLTPCLWFNRNAEEAVNFYVSIFKNSKIIGINYYGESGAQESGMPKGDVMSIKFELQGQEFLAINGGPVFQLSEAFSLMINCDDQAEIDTYFNKLSYHPESEVCGWVKDKFGLSWQLVPKTLMDMVMDKDPKRAERVFAALMKMKKIDIEKLNQAYAQ